MTSWIEISKSALLHNLSQYRKLIGKTKLMAVIKSNAYGHGLDVVPEIINDKVDWFGAVSGDEAIFLRDKGINKSILVLSFFDDDQIEELLRKNISLPVYTSEQIKKISAAANKLRLQAKVHVKVDTGTSRLGFNSDQIPQILDEIKKAGNITVEGMFSHLASSEDKPDVTKRQLQIFEDLIKSLEQRKIKIPLKHIACTASAQGFVESRIDLVRLGIGLYGLGSYKAKPGAKNTLDLKPALSWKTKLIQVRKVPKNTLIGYSGTYKTKKDSILGILPVGYYDGFDRKLSNKADVLIKGVRCPVRGRVCMNLIIVDLSNVQNVRVGDEAVLIGAQGHDEISANELAKTVGTINYEIIARLNPQIPRVVTN